VLVKRVVAVVLVTVASVASSHAQGFGRNKVRYENFDFQVLQTQHFDIYYDAAERDAVVQAGRLAERWYARLSKVLDHTFKERQPIVLYASHAQFTQTNVVSEHLGDGIGGVTEHERGRVILPFAAGLGETDHVLGHELVHAFQRDILKDTGRPIGTMPLWFVEGMAEYLSLGKIDTNTAMWLRDSVEQNSLPRIDQLEDPSFFPYRYGQALWAYLAKRFGDDVVAKSLKSKARGGAVGMIVAVTGVDAKSLSSAWQEFIRGAVARPKNPPPDDGSAETVLGGKNADSRLSVGPTLSPDGQAIAFFSDRSQHSIDMVVADTKTGAIRRRVVRTDGDPHFESLQFIDSAGAWAPDGHRLAMAALSGGVPVLTILNAATGSVERELPIRHADQVFSPTWSPDGKQIAFSVLHNGFSDLQVIDLETATVRSLTSDAFADVHPAWSPDGRSIAFSTDRFSSSIDTLTFGEFRLASIDVESGTIEALPGIARAKNIDPHWTPDGGSLYFVADADGVSNVYRLAIGNGAIFKVTDVSTGVSGISALSPSIAVSGDSNQLAYSVYRNGAYEIHLMDAPAGSPMVSSSEVGDRKNLDSVKPAADAAPERPVSGAVIAPTFGLQDGSEFTSKPYRAGLSLDHIVQPYLTAGGGGTGSFIRGGVGFSFGDMLGDHALRTAIQVGKSKDDFAAEASYVNMRRRWNWGVLTSQIPWLTSSSSAASRNAGNMFTQQVQLFREMHRQVTGAAFYPFSSAKRLELSGGVEAIGFGSETRTLQFSGVTGRLVNQTSVTNPSAPTELLGQTRAALVYDTSLYGPTSPILGRRYRLAVAPTFGGLNFTTVTADYRQYWMPVKPFTIAIRVMHVGRYGADANDQRLLPLVWTIRDVVRGYGDYGTGTGPLGSLSSSRIFVANSEVRFPILDVITGRSRAGALPIEGLVFSDFGRFYSTPVGLPDSASFMRSVGAGARINAAGMIFEFDAVRRFDASRGWTFAFNFRPGF
jgi:Tol biopolymer transport system component